MRWWAGDLWGREERVEADMGDAVCGFNQNENIGIWRGMESNILARGGLEWKNKKHFRKLKLR